MPKICKKVGMKNAHESDDEYSDDSQEKEADDAQEIYASQNESNSEDRESENMDVVEINDEEDRFYTQH